MNLLFEVLQNHRVTCRYSGHSGGGKLSAYWQLGVAAGSDSQLSFE